MEKKVKHPIAFQNHTGKITKKPDNKLGKDDISAGLE